MTNRLVIDDFLGGLAPSPYVGAPNQADPFNSKGWDVMAEVEEGILQRGWGEGTVTNASLSPGAMYAMKTITLNTNPYLFALGDNLLENGTILHRVTLADDTISATSPWPWTTAGAGGTSIGLEFYNGYLYYATGRYLGRYDLSLTFNNSFNISLSATAIWHPMSQANGKLMIGNGGVVVSLSGDVVNLAALDLSKTGKVIKALEFNRNFLYIAASQNYSDTNVMCDASLIVWDTVSGSWQEEFKFPENDLRALKFVNGTLYCLGNFGFYEFTGSNFQLIARINGGPGPYGIDGTPRSMVMFRDASANIYTYGTPSTAFKPILQKVINDAGSYQNAALKTATKTKVYIGSKSAAYHIRNFQSGSNVRGAAGDFRTVFLNLGQKVRIGKMYVVAEALPANCSVSFNILDDMGKTVSCGTWATTGETSYEYYPANAAFDMFQVQVLHAINTPSPKIRRIVLEYEIEKE
jgi:hypothetical protein